MKFQKKQKIYFSKRKGVTLIELLLAIAIIGIMTVVTLVGLEKAKPRSNVEMATRQLAASIRQVQNDALSGKMINNETACLFSIKIANSSDKLSYNSYYVSSQDGNCAATSKKKYDIEGEIGGVNYNGDTNIQELFFASPHASLANGGRIVLQSTFDNSIKWTLCINSKTGDIIEFEGNVNCP